MNTVHVILNTVYLLTYLLTLAVNFLQLKFHTAGQMPWYVGRCCLGGAAVRRRTRDRKVAGSVQLPAGALSSQLGQLSQSSLRGR